MILKELFHFLADLTHDEFVDAAKGWIKRQTANYVAVVLVPRQAALFW